MAIKLITALKENKNDIRKKVIITAGITVAAVAAGVVLAKMNDKLVWVELSPEVADAAATAVDAASE